MGFRNWLSGGAGLACPPNIRRSNKAVARTKASRSERIVLATLLKARLGFSCVKREPLSVRAMAGPFPPNSYPARIADAGAAPLPGALQIAALPRSHGRGD